MIVSRPGVNETSSVPAYRKFTRAENGLAYLWRVPKREPTRLWLNPPFSQNADFAEKLVCEWQKGGIEALVLDKHDLGWPGGAVRGRCDRALSRAQVRNL